MSNPGHERSHKILEALTHYAVENDRVTDEDFIVGVMRKAIKGGLLEAEIPVLRVHLENLVRRAKTMTDRSKAA